MIEQLIEETIAASKQEKAALVKEASDKEQKSEEDRSPVAFSLRKLADQVREFEVTEKSAASNESKTKVADAADNALKGLSLLQRFTRGNHAV